VALNVGSINEEIPKSRICEIAREIIGKILYMPHFTFSH
jgi:hypothetical protein